MSSHEINMSYVWKISLTAACGGFLFGYDWVVIGGAKPFYEVYFDIVDPAMSGWVMGSALIGCIIGALLSGAISDKFGRKSPLVFAACLFIASAVGSALADNLDAFVWFRILGGIGIGLASTISPMYIAEISPAKNRGKMVAVNQLTIVLGILAAQIVNLLIAEPVPSAATPFYILSSWNGQTGWRYMFGAEVIPAISFFVLMLMAPESPRWLSKMKREGKALSVLERIGSTDYAKKTLSEINASFDQESDNLKLTTIGASEIRPILVIGIVLAALQQWCGINVIFNYAQEIFASANFNIDSTLKSIVATGLVNLIFTVLALRLVDKVGRRKLMIIGTMALACIYTLIGLFYAMDVLGLPVLILVLCAIAVYATTIGPVTWVLLAEIFPNRIRGTAMSISTTTLWIASFILTFTFPILNNGLGASGTFFLYALICVAGFCFVFVRVPETKSLTLEELEDMLLKSDIKAKPVYE